MIPIGLIRVFVVHKTSIHRIGSVDGLPLYLEGRTRRGCTS